jgi:hypothetical protein
VRRASTVLGSLKCVMRGRYLPIGGR